MADNCHFVEGWPFHTAFLDGFWASDAIAHETETLTRPALPLRPGHRRPHRRHGLPPFLVNPEPAASCSASDAESRTRHPTLPRPLARKISKRKSRASRGPATTFIAADPANFRRMVQQVTGIPSPPAAEGAAAMRPEPRRLVDCLPTLDTSALLLGYGGAAAGLSEGPNPEYRAELTFRGAGLDGACFPTLESSSWDVM